MVIGPVGAGKSSLLRALSLGEERLRKTQALTYLGQAIDTPGEMLALPRHYSALILNSARARLVLLVQDGGRPALLPPRLAQALKAPALGVINKVEVSDPERLGRAADALNRAGVERIFQVSAVTGAGLEELKRGLEDFPA